MCPADEKLPAATDLQGMLARSATIGFAASVASDVASNAFYVVKTYKQVGGKGLPGLLRACAGRRAHCVRVLVCSCVSVVCVRVLFRGVG
jgi:hypothetical protein